MKKTYNLLAAGALMACTGLMVGQANATQGHDKITFCHNGHLISTDKAAFYKAGHIDHDGDIYPAGSLKVKNGKHEVTVTWSAHGDQSLLRSNCCVPTQEPPPTEEPSPTDEPDPIPTDTPTETPTETPSDNPTTTPPVPTQPPSMIPPTHTSVPKPPNDDIVKFHQHRTHITKVTEHGDGTVTRERLPLDQVVEEGF